jgi:hypothetical protein
LAAVIVAAGRQLKLEARITLTANGRAETRLGWQAAVVRPDADPHEPPNFLWQMVAALARQRLESFTTCLKANLESEG